MQRLTHAKQLSLRHCTSEGQKAAQEQPATEPVADTVTDSEVDPRKAAVAAAIARAKAKKQLKQNNSTRRAYPPLNNPLKKTDPRKLPLPLRSRE
ncbi:hypothetical protein J4727_06220 [Providencia rettgeri]|uniref:Electron transport complex protein RnfC n=1 Tax=Providencia rettgeri TaxID=587 RepID=A0A939SR71_PRORE|nr:hypothetical protein [Providencia rettgeri]